MTGKRTINLLKQALDTRLFLFLFAFVVIGGLFLSPAFAKERIVKQDLNKDGKTDWIAHFDCCGDILKLEADSNGNGEMEIDILKQSYILRKKNFFSRQKIKPGTKNLILKYISMKKEEKKKLRATPI